MTKPLKQIIVVSHTHHDREWYLPFEDFRWQLVKNVDQLLDLMEEDSRYRHFTLDGQTIVLEDYLEIRPENRPRVESLAKDGRLLIGPWYVLADEFLVSGEALIRNLLLGHQQAKALGPVMKVGYVPDLFGHIAQLPQLLRGFGIDSSVFWRGFDDKGESLPTETRWQSPDGSEVLNVHLGASYGIASNLPKDVDATLAQLLMPVTILGPRATSSAILLPNGSDHLPPQPHLPGLIESLNQRLKSSDVLAGQSLGDVFSRLLTTMESPASFFEFQPDVKQLEGSLTQLFSPTVESLKGVEFKHGTLRDYLDIVRQEVDVSELPVIHGEQRSSKHFAILPGVLSARIYLKQANFASQMLLERWAEPFATIAWWLGAPYPTVWLKRAWKFLLKNHPHDSICGCSIDSVHEDMERRYEWCQQLTNNVLSDAITTIIKHADTTPPTSVPEPCFHSFLVFNPHTWAHTDVVRIILHTEKPAESLKGSTLYDAVGNPIPAQITPGPQIDSALHPFIDQHHLPSPESGEPKSIKLEHTLLVTFVAKDVPSLGYASYHLAPTLSDKEQAKSALKIGEGSDQLSAENPFIQLKLSPSDGTLTLHHKPSKRRYKRLLTFEDTGDVGDEYNYCPPTKDRRVTTHRTRPTIRLVEQGPVVATWEITSSLTVPEEAATSRGSRSTNTTKLALRTLVSIYDGVPRVDVSTHINNTAKDHRFRVLFPTSLKADTAWADTPFHVTERPIKAAVHEWETPLYPTLMDLLFTYAFQSPAVPGKPLGWFEDASTTHPQQTFVDVTSESAGLMIASRGLPEYEVLDDKQRTIAITLLRAIGWLSRNDLTTRRGNAGPSLATHGAQCLGPHTYHYAIIPHKGTWRDSKTLRQAQAFAVPLRSIQISQHKPASLETLSGRHSFLSIEPDNLFLSALKKAEKIGSTVLRFYDACGIEVTARVQTSITPDNIAAATLAEEPSLTPELQFPTSQTMTLTITPHRIQTLMFQLRKRS
ncbi:MAG: alpha-mannosidase [Promethearchaeota archaeon]